MRHACVRRQCGQLRPRSIQIADHTGDRIPPPPSGEHRAPHVRRGWWAGCKYRSALGDPEWPEVETRICQTVWESHLQTKQKNTKVRSADRVVTSTAASRPLQIQKNEHSYPEYGLPPPLRGPHDSSVFFHRTGPQKTCDAENTKTKNTFSKCLMCPCTQKTNGGGTGFQTASRQVWPFLGCHRGPWCTFIDLDPFVG